MLEPFVRFNQPFEFFTSQAALPNEQLRHFDALFELELDWTAHGGSFYEVDNCDVTQRLPTGLRQALVERVSQISELSLLDSIQVTLQRMSPGQQVGLHSDRPLVGYETLRLVVQLSADWAPEHGGVLRVHPDEDPADVSRELPPIRNSAFGFVMRAGSHHSVTATRRERRSVVFNFWHIGNSPSLAEHVQSLFAELSFAALPDELASLIAAAEQRHLELDTHRAACVAIALQRWGYPASTQAQGYRSTVQPVHPALNARVAPREQAAGLTSDGWGIALAQWATRLLTSDYDLSAWQHLERRLRAHERNVPLLLRPFYTAAFPPGIALAPTIARRREPNP